MRAINTAALCLLISIFLLVAHAVPLKLSLGEMVKASDLIVIGKTSDIRQEPSDKARQRVILDVAQTVKGIHQQQLTVHLSSEWSFESTLRLGDTYLLFLQRNGPEIHVVQGYGGRVLLDGGKAKAIFMDGEAETQDIAKFVKRIKSYQGK
jgi:hypothetical protein